MDGRTRFLRRVCSPAAIQLCLPSATGRGDPEAHLRPCGHKGGRRCERGGVCVHERRADRPRILARGFRRDGQGRDLGRHRACTDVPSTPAAWDQVRDERLPRDGECAAGQARQRGARLLERFTATICHLPCRESGRSMDLDRRQQRGDAVDHHHQDEFGELLRRRLRRELGAAGSGACGRRPDAADRGRDPHRVGIAGRDSARRAAAAPRAWRG